LKIKNGKSESKERESQKKVKQQQNSHGKLNVGKKGYFESIHELCISGVPLAFGHPQPP
jgi:hypothetical protein